MKQQIKVTVKLYVQNELMEKKKSFPSFIETEASLHWGQFMIAGKFKNTQIDT